MAAEIKVPALFTAKDKFSHVVSKMTRGVKKFSSSSISSVKRFDNKITSSFKRVSKLGLLVGGLTIGTLFSAAAQGNIEFNDSLASVSAITGQTGDDLANLELLAKKTGKQTRKSGSEILKAYELVGSAKPELLESADSLDEVTRSVITLSKASRMDLEASTGSLTDVMNQFNKTGSESKDVVEALARGAKFGSAAIPQISEAIVQFGTVAKQSNVSLIESVAGVELFASKGIKGAEAGTKMRNVLTTLATAKALPRKALNELSKFGVNLDIVSNKALPLSDRLKEMSKISGDATAMVKVFGKENQGAGAILINNIKAFDDLNTKIGAKDGTNVALEQAAINTNTLAFGLASIKTGFLNATTATNSNNAAMSSLKELLFSVGDNMDTILIVGASLIGMYGLMKAVILANTIVTGAYNIALGINTAITGNNKRALITNIAAQNAYKVAMGIGTAITWVATAATTAFGIALNLGLWPILAIIAAVTLVVLVIRNWGTITEWFAKTWTEKMQSIKEAWSEVVSWFKEFDFKGMFVDIGQSIIKFMLLPLTGILTLLSKIPGGIGDFAKLGLDEVGKVTGDISVDSSEKSLPSSAQASGESVTRNITKSNSNVKIDIVDKGGNVDNVSSDNNDIPVSLGSTLGAY